MKNASSKKDFKINPIVKIPNERDSKKIQKPKNISINISKGRIINKKGIAIKFITLFALFFPVLSEIYQNHLSEITIRIRGRGLQTIFRKRENCIIPNEIYDVKKNSQIEKINCKSDEEFCNISVTEEESTIKMTWNENEISICEEFFLGLTNLIEADLTKLNVSLVNMGNLFKNCTSLTYVNLTNIDTTQTTNMGNLFTNCSSLTTVDLSSFDTSKVESIDKMFYNCSLITSLNLSHFNTLQVNNFEDMFYNCIGLTSLNLSNFGFSSINYNKESDKDRQLKSMFINCWNLNYLNIYNYEIKSSDKKLTLEQIIGNTKKNLAICINKDNIIEEFENQQRKNAYCPTFDCNENYYKHQKKVNEDETNWCIERCSSDINYPYEYKNICYKSCPINTSQDENNICIEDEEKEEEGSDEEEEVEKEEDIDEKYIITELPKISKENTFITNYYLSDTYINKNITKNNICNIKDFFANNCKNNFLNDEEKDSFKYDIIASIIDGSMSSILTKVVNNGEDFIIKEGNEVYQISTLKNQMNIENLTNINLTECVELLKEKGYIFDEELVILKIEHSIEGYKIPVIEYVLFDEFGFYINLDYCENISSLYYIPVSINENNLFLHDPSSDYYNDECNKFTSENGTDVTMYDRKNDYNENHLSLCEANCTFKGYSSNTSKAECECKTKSYLYTVEDFYSDDFLDKMENEEKITNLNLMKCSNLISSADDIKNNPGFFLLALIIILFIIVMIIFCVRGYNNLEKKIDEVISIKFKSDKNNDMKNKTRSLINEVIPDRNKSIKKHSARKDKKFNSFLNKNSKTTFIKEDNQIIRNKDKKQTMIKLGNKNDDLNINKNIDNDEDFLKSTNDYELNNLSYDLAIKYDKREFCDYYFSLIRTKQIIFFSFCDFNDYNSGVVKKFIFFLSFALHYTINALFFTDKVMHQIYQDGGKYNIIFQLPFITYSAIISTIILRIMLITLVLTEKSVLEVKNQKSKLSAENKKKKVLKCAIIKFAIFFALNLILLVIFWFYLACFNALYANTQIALIINTAISLAMSCIYPFIINIIPAFFRTDILKNKPNKKVKISISDKKDSEYAYKISQWLQLL